MWSEVIIPKLSVYLVAGCVLGVKMDIKQFGPQGAYNLNDDSYKSNMRNKVF